MTIVSSPRSAMRRIPEIFFLLLLATQVASATPVRISIQWAGTPADAGTVRGILKLVPSLGTAQIREVPIPGPGEQQIDLEPGRTWEVHFEGKGFWGEPLTLAQLPAAAESRRLRVFPAGKVRAKLATVAGERPLKSLALRLQPALAPNSDPFEAVIACPVADGVLACSVPVGRFDLRLRAEGGWAPIYLWDVPVAAGKETPLGELRLRRGASVSGWVQTAEGGSPSHDCRLKLSPASADSDDPKVQDQIEKSSLEVQPNEKGFFQIVGVPPGRYELTARQPGYAEIRTGPVDVRPDLESQVIDRLTLARPVKFDIALDPPLEPYGRPWRIELSRRADPSETPASFLAGKASQEGIWHVPGVAPGIYELSVRGELKDVWYREFLEIHPGQSDLRIDLPVLRVEGRILIGKEPLAATLWLSQKGGRRLRFDSDERGRFSGVLPGEGLWAPKVEMATGKLQVSLESIEIKPPQGKNLAQVEIPVPDTKLAGQVVDEEGHPLPAAKVFAASTERKGTNPFETDEKGEFSVRGLQPGSWLVKAEQGDRQSDFQPVSLPAEGEAPWLRIVARKLQTLEGRIVSAAGPVAGARVLAWPPFNGQSGAGMADAVSGGDGSFHVELPAGTALLNLAVLPPGYAMRLTAVPVSPGQPIEIPVEPQGGTLILDMPEDGPTPILVHGGVYVLPMALKMWARMQGGRATDSGRLVLPAVEAGPYSVCRGAAAVTRMKEGGEPPAAGCTSGVLAPNGELELRSPGVRPARTQ
jgi:hypothetical protein